MSDIRNAPPPTEANVPQRNLEPPRQELERGNSADASAEVDHARARLLERIRRDQGARRGPRVPDPAKTERASRAPRSVAGAIQRRDLKRRDGCLESPAASEPLEEKAAYLPLSRTTDRVLHILLEGDLSRLRAESVAESLGISCTTLRRRLRNDHTNYQFLLDRARQYRCEACLRERWLPGKCLADELGYLEVNSFYRAFRRWTGQSYSAYKLDLELDPRP
ncbi:MAG: AraC family transcriptional regulator [Pseudomonadota bacterium]